MRTLNLIVARLAAVVLLTAPAVLSTARAESPGATALSEHLGDKKAYNVVQNRFFLKSQRFEVSPTLGYVPNNPMVKRYVGSVLGAYHFNETIAAEGAFLYSPDAGGDDLKDLTHTLVGIADQGRSKGGTDFQQPLDKMIMGATFAARWAPFYGKINLIGETVLNFDFYGVAGLGMLSLQSYYAKYDDKQPTEIKTVLHENGRKTKVTPNLGLGFNFFVNSTIAVKLDGRSYFYVDTQPQYDPETPETESRLYNNFVASVGVSFFMPKMKPRLYNF